MNRIFFLLLLIAIPFLHTAPSYAEKSPHQIPVEEFAQLPVLSLPRLSPDGKRVAFQLNKNGRSLVVIKDISEEFRESNADPKFVGFADKYIQSIDWANNERVILNIRTPYFGSKKSASYGRLVAVSADKNAGPPVDLSSNLVVDSPERHFITHFNNDVRFVDDYPKDPNKILAILEWTESNRGFSSFERYHPEFYLVDVYTGDAKKYQRNVRAYSDLFVDSDGEVRAAWSTSRVYPHGFNRVHLDSRASESSQWQRIVRTTYLENSNLEPIRFDDDDKNILLFTNANYLNYEIAVDETFAPLYRYDLIQQEILGEYKNKAQLQAKAFAKQQLNIDALEIVSEDDNKQNFIVRTMASHQPSSYYVVNAKQSSLIRLGKEYPALEKYTLPSTRYTHYSARDGFKVYAHVTYPLNQSRGDDKPSLVVLPHTLLFDRDKKEFDIYAQFLASRGYVVLQPQFRGSTGLGIKYEVQGYGEWGGVTQDDIDDGVRWLIDAGEVDPANVCIMGTGFGGYSALWGALKSPNLYQCSVVMNGFLDLSDHLYHVYGRSLKDWYGRQLFNERKDMWARSPMHNLSAINSSVLYIASVGDSVTRIKDARKYRKKLSRVLDDVSYVELERGEFERVNTESELIKLRAIEKFLAEQLN